MSRTYGWIIPAMMGLAAIKVVDKYFVKKRRRTYKRKR